MVAARLAPLRGTRGCRCIQRGVAAFCMTPLPLDPLAAVSRACGQEGLGKEGTGITAPIDAISGMGGMLTNDRRGVGAGSTSTPVVMPGDTYKTAVRKVVRRACSVTSGC